jgi:RNA polymerase sigma factor for flagellar operon FliA
MTRMKFCLIDPPECLKMITDAVQGLTPDGRLVLSLRYLEELTLEEIATVLRVSEARASQLHTETMTQLQANLKRNDSR